MQMDVTEAPQQQDADDLLAAGWAAPVSLAPDALDAAQCLIVAQRNVIHERNETVARLGYEIVTAEGQRDAAASERDAALGMAHRYQTAMLRLDVDNRALRERNAGLERALHQAVRDA